MPSATALAIKDGVITYIGNDAPTAYIGLHTQVIDAGGRLVLPGFQDAHVHVVEAGINESLSVLPQFGTAAQYRVALRQAVAEQPGGAGDWVIGAGVNMAALLENIASPLSLIDEEIPRRPVVILDDLGHGAWANSLALAAVSFDQLAANPPGGIIDVNQVNRLTGVIFESASQNLVDASQPPTAANLDFAYQSFLKALEIFAKHGITTVSDAGGYWPRGHHHVWMRAENENKLTVRANNAFYVYPEKDFAQQVADITALRTNDPNKLVRFNQVKLYTDGIISQTTAALLSPYESAALPALATPTGFTYFDPTALNHYAAAFDAAGFQLHFHATGDRGARLALDAIAYAQTTNNSTDKRHRITHLFMVDPVDVPRFAQLGVYADFQLTATALTDENLADVDFFIGQRSAAYLPARTLLDAGAELTLSSDFDADELSPFIKIEGAITRPTQNIPDVATAIRLMTLQPAKLLHHEDKTGSLELGKLADLIIVDRDILTIPTNQISEANVLLTLLGGKEVFRDPQFQPYRR